MDCSAVLPSTEFLVSMLECDIFNTLHLMLILSMQKVYFENYMNPYLKMVGLRRVKFPLPTSVPPYSLLLDRLEKLACAGVGNGG